MHNHFKLRIFSLLVRMEAPDNKCILSRRKVRIGYRMLAGGRDEAVVKPFKFIFHNTLCAYGTAGFYKKAVK